MSRSPRLSKDHNHKITSQDEHAIRIALMSQFREAMKYMDLHEGTSLWIRIAYDTWQAYKNLTGRNIR